MISEGEVVINHVRLIIDIFKKKNIFNTTAFRKVSCCIEVRWTNGELICVATNHKRLMKVL